MAGSNGDAALELRGLSKRYGAKTALEEVSFAVGAGQMFGFVGPNGAGKTTTMRIVLGVLARRRRRGALAGRADRRRGAAPDRLHAGGARALPEDAGARPARLYGRAARRRARRRARGGRALDRAAGDRRAGRATRSRRSRSATSSACSWRWRWSTNRSCWSSTSPSPASTPSGSTPSAASCARSEARGVPVVFSSHQLELVERLCDSVAIIAAGRIALTGRVAELEGSLADTFREATRR